MKCVGIVDFSGKEGKSLTVKLLKELRRREYKVALIKRFTTIQGLAEKDISEEEIYTQTIVNCFPGETIFSFKNAKSLEDILALIDADYVLIEGFEEDKSYPRIAIMGESRKGDCFNGLEIAGYGEAHVPHFPVTQDITQLVNTIEDKSFKLPHLDCTACGFDSCYAFAQEIIKGNKKLEDCVSLNPKVEVKIEGTPLPMNTFISGIVENTVRALLSSFKGYKKGHIEISIS